MENKYFESEDELEHLRKYKSKMIKEFLFGKSVKELKPAKKLKWAYIIVNDNKELCMINPENMDIAFKINNYEVTGEEIKDFKFDRWLTSMDI